MTLLDDLHAIRVRANLIEARVSALRPEPEADPRAVDLWAETMALTGEQFHGITLAIRAAADLDLGCGPTAAELEADAAAAENLSHSVAAADEPPLAPIVSLPRSRADEPEAPPSFVIRETGPSSVAWVAVALAIALAAAIVVAVVFATT